MALLDHGFSTGPAIMQPPSRPPMLIVPYRNKDKAPSLRLVDFGPHLWLSCNICNTKGRRMTGDDMLEREQGASFLPRFDDKGLLTTIVVDSRTREVLMVAFMDAEALARSRETGLAHFHSRSRRRLWLKGETSGNFLRIEEIRVDCDQDALVLLVKPEGPACHTGATSCFYRRLAGDALERMG